MNAVFPALQKLIASRRFFWLIVAVFILQAVWLVFSAVYPMAFDEGYHIGVIQQYARQWLPFLAERPDGVDRLGVITRDTSYLYHYLMSFPYRLVSLFTDNFAAHVIILRLVNVGLFTASLVLFRRVFKHAGVSDGLANVSILLFTLIPIVPLLAAQVNYDNLLLVLVAWISLLVAHSIQSLRRARIPVATLLLLGAVAVFSAIVKYAVLPILLAVAVFVVFYGWRVFRGQTRQYLARELKHGWRRMQPAMKIGLPLVLLLGSLLFFERYGVNLIRYQTPLPDCEQVLTAAECRGFGPWERQERYTAQKEAGFRADPASHLNEWTRGMWYRTFFMVNGDVPAARYHNFAPLPLPAAGATVILVVGVLATLRWYKVIFFSRPYLVFLASMVGVYVSVLWLSNYVGYTEVGQTAGLNGRYLLVIFLPLIAVIGHGIRKLLEGRSRIKTGAAVLAVLVFLHGGGTVSFIIRSSDHWYWPHPAVHRSNETARDFLAPLVIGSGVNEELHFINPDY